jgi:beta-galactosidase
MNFKTILAAAAMLLFASNSLFAQVLMPSFKDTRQIISLNGTWKFKYLKSNNTSLGKDSAFFNPGFNLSKWATIKVPGNWEMQGFANPEYKKLKDAVGLYRTGFTIPENWKGNPVYIAFEGVEMGYTLWINGQEAGSFASAFNRQVFDITSFILPGKSNTLAVKVITHPRGYEFDTNDDWALSGISRDVTVFSLPPTHIKDLVIQTFVNNNDASIKINTSIEKSIEQQAAEGLNVTGKLFDAAGKLVNEFVIAANQHESTADVQNFTEQITVQKPNLWSAENPYLYTLQVFVKSNKTVVQQYTEKIGIREVAWNAGVLKLNGAPIKLKGVNHHDISPVNGRAISEAEMIQDLKLMQAGNINFIRTSHYPPHPRLLELCDSMGMYVMDEVPYGYGDELLTDSTYLPILKQRATSTIWRDKNRPCVIIWSVGNENPVTAIGLKTGRYVKTLDATRPYCFPQVPNEFWKMFKAIPDSIDILDFHYPKQAELRKLTKELDRPMIASEYTHALGLDFGSMEESYEIMYENEKLAGGAVWEFMDQGLLRKAPEFISKNDATFYVWPTKDSIYDTGGNQGTDGVMYADRTPQTDYWHIRKAFTPVKAIDDSLQYKGGKQSFKIRVMNRYDFTNLSIVKCKWQLFADTKILATGTSALNCKPHDTATIAINTILPEKPTAQFYYLKLVFEDKGKMPVYEKTFLIEHKKKQSILSAIASQKTSKPIKNDDVITTANYSFGFEKNTGSVKLKTKEGTTIIAAGPFARVGRKPSMAQNATTSSNRSKILHTIWNPFLLSKPETAVKQFDAKQLIVNYTYQPDSLKDRLMPADIAYHFSDSGYITVNYRSMPSAKEEAVEAGLSFLIPSSLTQFRWTGKGPYAAYPGKSRQSEFGIYHLSSNDLYFPGNRQNVTCAVFTDADGNGFALIAGNANIAVERTAEGIIVSHNAHVSGAFNKYEWPDDLLSFKEGKAIEGNFSIVPFTAATFPTVLKNVFGDAKKVAQAFQPFYHSYDQ